MKKFRFLSLVLVGCLCVATLSGCGEKKGWTRNDTATIGMGDAARAAVILANNETPSEKAPITGDIDLIKTNTKDEFILYSVELRLFGDTYKENSVTGALNIHNGSGRSYQRGDITARFSIYQNREGVKQNYYTLKFERSYVDADDNEKSTIKLETETEQMKINIKEDLTFKFSYTDNNGATQQFEYTIVAADIKKA